MPRLDSFSDLRVTVKNWIGRRAGDSATVYEALVRLHGVYMPIGRVPEPR